MGSHHKNHDIKDVVNIVTRKKENIKKETEEIKNSILPKNKTREEEVEKKIFKSMAHYSGVEKEAKEKREKWHLEVDSIFNTFELLIQSLRDHEMTILKSYQVQLRNQTADMTQTVQENKDILKSNNVSDVVIYSSKLTKFRTIPPVPDVRSPSLKTKTVQGRILSLELGDYRATLAQTALSLPSLTDEVLHLSVKKLLKNAKIIASIPTDVKNLKRVACAGSDKAWISGKDEIIHCVDIHGTVQDAVPSTCPEYPSDITVSKEGELIYSDVYNRTVNIVRRGKTEALITIPRGWGSSGLSFTRSEDILVSMNTIDYSRQYKIVRYQGKKVTQEIDKDGSGNPIYQGGEYALYVKENINGDIVASDGNANTVVVVNRKGKVRFQYNDKPLGERQPFSPRQIVTDSMGNIIVADTFNDCLHILDQNGQFIKYVDNFGLNGGPNGLSVDSEGRLWVGLYYSGEVKVIQYV
jgi:hypothetical protein